MPLQAQGLKTLAQRRRHAEQGQLFRGATIVWSNHRQAAAVAEMAHLLGDAAMHKHAFPGPQTT